MTSINVHLHISLRDHGKSGTPCEAVGIYPVKRKKKNYNGGCHVSQYFLPPAYVVRTTGGYVFTGVCVFNFVEGGVHHHRSGGGVPHPRSRQEVPHPISRWGGGTPSQVWMGGTWGTHPP